MQDTLATIITSLRSDSEQVAEWRSLSISSLIAESFFYICVGAGDIRLRLIIVVIGNKILHRVFGEEFPELTAKLCGKGLVVCQH